MSLMQHVKMEWDSKALLSLDRSRRRCPLECGSACRAGVQHGDQPLLRPRDLAASGAGVDDAAVAHLRTGSARNPTQTQTRRVPPPVSSWVRIGAPWFVWPLEGL